MGIKKFKPVTPSSRFRTVHDRAEISAAEPERSLLEPIRKSGGRNNDGHITSRRSFLEQLLIVWPEPLGNPRIAW